MLASGRVPPELAPPHGEAQTQDPPTRPLRSGWLPPSWRVTPISKTAARTKGHHLGIHGSYSVSELGYWSVLNRADAGAGLVGYGWGDMRVTAAGVIAMAIGSSGCGGVVAGSSHSGDGGIADAIVEGDSGDSRQPESGLPPGTALAACMSLCSGVCDANGACHASPPSGVTSCGSTTCVSCGPQRTPCCNPSGQCSCSPAVGVCP